MMLGAALFGASGNDSGPPGNIGSEDMLGISYAEARRLVLW